MQPLKILAFLALISPAASAAEIHVSVKGTDNNDGSAGKPLRTIIIRIKTSLLAIGSTIKAARTTPVRFISTASHFGKRTCSSGC